jgi:hypothetical protein
MLGTFSGIWALFGKFVTSQACHAFIPARFGMLLGIYRKSSWNYRQNARKFGIGIAGNSKGLFGRVLRHGEQRSSMLPIRARQKPTWTETHRRRRWWRRRRGGGSRRCPARRRRSPPSSTSHSARGRAVQVAPIKPTFKPPIHQRLKLQCAFKFNLRRYNVGPGCGGAPHRLRRRIAHEGRAMNLDPRLTLGCCA